MKKFFKEFKAFISRGNVMDMAVGIIIGGAFTAIITAIVNNILTPLLSAIPGSNETSALQVVLREASEDGLTEAIVIDFGAVISAVVAFLLTALVLFILIKIINGVRDGGRKLAEKQKKAIEKRVKKGELSAEEAAKQEAVVEETVAAPAAPTTEELLAEIRDLLKAQHSDKQ